MSKAKEAETKDSLSLSYPSHFIIAAPIRAFCNRFVPSYILNARQLKNPKALSRSLVWIHHTDHRDGNNASYGRHILVLNNEEILYRKCYAVLDNSTTSGPGCSAQ